MPDQERRDSLTDRELLLLLEQRVRLLDGTIKDTYHDLREQLARGNARFEQLSIAAQQTDARIVALSNMTQRAHADARHADEATAKMTHTLHDLADRLHGMEETLYGDKEREQRGLVQDVRRNTHTLQAFSYYARVAAVIFGLIQLLLVPIYNLLLQHYLGL